MMNKKGGGFFQFVANAAIVTAIIYFIFIMVFGAGGGFSATFKAGQFLGSLPGWGNWSNCLSFIFNSWRKKNEIINNEFKLGYITLC